MAGESVDAPMKQAYTPNPIAIDSFKLNFDIDDNWAEPDKVSGGNQVPNPRFGELIVEKEFDAVSTELFLSLCGAAVHNEVKLLQRRAGGIVTQAGDLFLTMTFKDVVVSKVEWNANGPGQPAETIYLNFASFEIKYTPQKASGGHDASKAITASYSISRDSEGS
jgi:type VI protein secretion system component Hcp